MTDDNEQRLVFAPEDAPDPDRVYANYLRTCAMAGIEPVSRERALGFDAGVERSAVETAGTDGALAAFMTDARSDG